MAGDEKRGSGGIWGDPAPSPALVINPTAPAFRAEFQALPRLPTRARLLIGHCRKLTAGSCRWLVAALPLGVSRHCCRAWSRPSGPCRPVRRLEAGPSQGKPPRVRARVRADDPPLPPSATPRATRPGLASTRRGRCAATAMPLPLISSTPSSVRLPLFHLGPFPACPSPPFVIALETAVLLTASVRTSHAEQARSQEDPSGEPSSPLLLRPLLLARNSMLLCSCLSLVNVNVTAVGQKPSFALHCSYKCSSVDARPSSARAHTMPALPGCAPRASRFGPPSAQSCAHLHIYGGRAERAR
ncbi:hypothetical protein DAEQUDRAFT_281124 [Daedalea quercina L-15889]|uniref:Uncharacterized protein n=1 Tax=Daedalea quercina L-15889 TaxID=1314783 RepID=A0A165Q999_9APHY|nr:hypothetical protein DAEQUDRAFT_281124 [Daedalea quercina L-15889]